MHIQASAEQLLQTVPLTPPSRQLFPVKEISAEPKQIHLGKIRNPRRLREIDQNIAIHHPPMAIRTASDLQVEQRGWSVGAIDSAIVYTLPVTEGPFRFHAQHNLQTGTVKDLYRQTQPSPDKQNDSPSLYKFAGDIISPDIRNITRNRITGLQNYKQSPTEIHQAPHNISSGDLVRSCGNLQYPQRRSINKAPTALPRRLL